MVKSIAGPDVITGLTVGVAMAALIAGGSPGPVGGAPAGATLVIGVMTSILLLLGVGSRTDNGSPYRLLPDNPLDDLVEVLQAPLIVGPSVGRLGPPALLLALREGGEIGVRLVN